ncbi:hypothetical protein LSUE1_G006773 [Lachnellula suecica]|uniref:DNA-directed RNA polymerase III subunit n=1 Tax=Lachnellula suecica TaxID=602035 RepID=A0A8T9C8D4_9HELO|nr:hypothetical protein LSUE1_G006773 [Lachnellula suecica]
MSFRGGRGGGGPGRGGLKGATWTQDEDLEIIARKMKQINKGKTSIFPVSDIHTQHKRGSNNIQEHPTGANVKRPKPMTARERRQVRHFKALQELTHRGPLYTQSTKRNVENPVKTFSEEQFNMQYGTDRKANMDPFTEGVETYSDRHAPPKNVIPRLSGRPFNKELFPEELWSTLEGDEGNQGRRHLNYAINRKFMDPAARMRAQRARLDRMEANGGDDIEGLDEDMPEIEEEMDDEYDDDEMGDDYNAEQYFDNGDDMDDDGDGGGADDY